MNSSLLKSVLGGDASHRLPPKIPSGRPGQRKEMDFSPLDWSHYFSGVQDVHIATDSSSPSTFRVYSGGASDSSLLLVLLHGGGYSGLTWALFSSELTKRVTVECLAIDLRGHGNTHTADDKDLSADTMCKDISAVVKEWRKQKLQKGTAVTGVVLLGHSMGGALAVRVASQQLVDDIVGAIVIDVVEGTAIEALDSMQAFLKSRPKSFPSLDAAIAWSMKTGQTRNIEAARVSMPGQVIKDASPPKAEPGAELQAGAAELHNLGGITEEEEEGEGTAQQPVSSSHHEQEQVVAAIDQKSGDAVKWVWRIDLSQTEHFWPGWFENLSKLFLSLTCPRVLVLAGMDRLDKDLTVGQMRGQFQLQALDKVGHAVQEDAPDRLADVVATFLIRNKLSQPIGNVTQTFPCC